MARKTERSRSGESRERSGKTERQTERSRVSGERSKEWRDRQRGVERSGGGGRKRKPTLNSTFTIQYIIRCFRWTHYAFSCGCSK